ncbi:hypothetical protein ATANTOWER_002616 [Ataeniobius toweri]|uniref:Ig-like domain-containing protein n=1 Tax=Ataeniobius toweri TaxID=208326 RepID=A0ABU7C575_9TELE|nr:hypothetical protein [Ataeniobius toweri]
MCFFSGSAFMVKPDRPADEVKMFGSHRGHQWFSLLFEVLLHVLLGLCLRDVEASGEKQVIHRKVGDSVELSFNLPTEGVSRPSWKYKNLAVAHENGVIPNNPFQDRVEFNNVNFSLTVRELTLQDSGDFSFTSATEVQQRPTVIITLQVHEPISKQPDLFSNISEPDLNGFCTVYLDCRAASQSNITYIWNVGNQNYTGPKLQHTIGPQDGDTTFFCTASNVISEMSAFKSVRCRNNTDILSKEGCGFSPIIFWVRLFIGLLVVLLLVSLLRFRNSTEIFCARLKHNATADQDQTQQDPCSSPPPVDASVYKTLRGSTDAEQGEASDEYVQPQQVPIKDWDNLIDN